MAEQSIGMATGTGAAFGDGNVGSGYASSRMTAMETKTLSDGVLQTGSLLAMSGTGTSSLTFASGAAIVGGYFYENTSSAAISVATSVADGTYTAALLVNATAGSLSVITKSAAGTTIGTYSVRLVIATTAQITTPGTGWNALGYSYLVLGTVAVAGGIVGTITPAYTMYGTTTQLPYQSYAWMSGGTATLTNVNISYDITTYTASDRSADLIFSNATSTGIITVRRAGLYAIAANITYGTASTGTRNAQLKVNGTTVQRNMMTPGAATSYLGTTWMQVLAAGDTVNMASNTLTTAAQSVTDCLFTIARV
jgi:hypothetical protein